MLREPLVRLTFINMKYLRDAGFHLTVLALISIDSENSLVNILAVTFLAVQLDNSDVVTVMLMLLI